MTFFDFIDIFSNLISLAVVIATIYIYFKDTFKRWIFFGYKPTAIVIVIDRKNNKVLLLNKQKVYQEKNEYPWLFPQGGIYSSDLPGTVENIIERELGLNSIQYDFVKTIVLGTKRIAERKVFSKTFLGSFSLYSSFRGKGYVACLVYLRSPMSKLKLDRKSIGEYNMSQALKLIDPVKAQMLLKYMKYIC